ncbi:2-polyprenyl-3-methyl-6-methoxy-1,4-benzoquinone monooxygenase [Oleiagrimonas soli]|uniref:3-demethoxyubiquinol 3-hydroxylase n=1 Tax=Oleiagrimonas soli TaxID=1543381 RepID=A0A099CV47_9GAMM|nr:2-polyprenyl-3-methyl-6-methoxy-1,4-benzoquinone monooxygenase [Oleiagrimonas soli]KGI76900.1 2-octaprenyl-3-methyl-6-methoxy-1,4-benzoquinol hydroxylase [Oleiagrimonas soli]MBB6185242.1 ubiquinone biosynthesis monooxygenase Coq7 [Oleiagrimonas soli]
MTARTLTALDRFLIGVENALEAVAGRPDAHRPSPALTQPEVELDDADRRHAAGLMRINHTGEVCAQALYKGQALLARDEDTREHLLHAAEEETDHLAWCADRLRELDSRPSLLNPLWYVGSMAIGAAAAAVNDRVSLGFVVETERQVEAHLAEHIERLPAEDERSRVVLRQMQEDEIRHADNALARGGIELPAPIPTLMALTSKVMKAVAYRI